MVGCGFFWRKCLNFSLLKVSDQSLSLVGEVSGHSCVITAVYVSINGAKRLHLWRQLEEVEGLVDESSWLVGGDFNIIANVVESYDFESLGPYESADMEAFRNCLSSLELIDHPFVGLVYTWSNRQDMNFLARKLDRVLINSKWLEEFPNSFVEFKAQGVSDHCPALVSFFKENHANRPKPFKFFNCWARHGEFLNILANLSHAGCYIDEEKSLQNELHDLEVAEASFYKQKAKVYLLREGDRNTKFFHYAVMRKRRKNTVRLLYTEDGSRLDTFETMSAEMVRFYTVLLGMEDSCVKSCDADVFKGLLGYELPCATVASLVKEISNEEIKASLFKQGNEKSPGPDGYTTYFFKVAWDIIQVDFLVAIRDFF
ncbi:uncharacterized protein LOC120210907 [Hibiscus syriacus]|uniref:uncharacterized protein LOC120210907 n=1 Tax=Hibiscus syriacus TaxID=106335 RepID=UPI001922E419|nr:uncharacterized protein LOC120210907 [Hibiscus syriacus]